MRGTVQFLAPYVDDAAVALESAQSIFETRDPVEHSLDVAICCVQELVAGVGCDLSEPALSEFAQGLADSDLILEADALGSWYGNGSVWVDGFGELSQVDWVWALSVRRCTRGWLICAGGSGGFF